MFSSLQPVFQDLTKFAAFAPLKTSEYKNNSDHFVSDMVNISQIRTMMSSGVSLSVWCTFIPRLMLSLTLMRF